MIRIDGSFGEGGGQILRTSLSLSIVTGQPFRIENIRAKRERSGLLRQHLTAVRAAAEICAGQVEGASLGSTALTFKPGCVKSGDYHFAIGSAGSGTLVLQTVLPALMTASGPSKIVIEGGTHNQAAPPFHFLERAFLPLVRQMGPRMTLQLERYGFYPAGGGRFVVEIQPSKTLAPIELPERGEIVSRRVIAIVANLPRHIAQREVTKVADVLNWGPELTSVEETKNSAGPGNIVMVEVGDSACTEVFSGFGQLGVSAEQVAEEVAREASDYIVGKASAGEHLTDQLLLPMALAGGGVFTAQKINQHSRTNMNVIETFLPIRFKMREEEGFTRVFLHPA
ncbi:MAG: RNA 3'-terminal phosphate cyclase [Acidobacteriia bacterium]|nr:RNA 3'-terminal phosphate cyclase [Terriglobia bacterium]